MMAAFSSYLLLRKLFHILDITRVRLSYVVVFYRHAFLDCIRVCTADRSCKVLLPSGGSCGLVSLLYHMKGCYQTSHGCNLIDSLQVPEGFDKSVLTLCCCHQCHNIHNTRLWQLKVLNRSILRHIRE